MSILCRREGWPLTAGHTLDIDDRPPICPVCGVTMLPAGLSARCATGRDWVCVECEEMSEPDEQAQA